MKSSSESSEDKLTPKIDFRLACVNVRHQHQFVCRTTSSSAINTYHFITVGTKPYYDCNQIQEPIAKSDYTCEFINCYTCSFNVQLQSILTEWTPWLCGWCSWWLQRAVSVNLLILRMVCYGQELQENSFPLKNSAVVSFTVVFFRSLPLFLVFNGFLHSRLLYKCKFSLGLFIQQWGQNGDLPISLIFTLTEEWRFH